jgi:endonuclease YncB( thermonuclease family)
MFYALLFALLFTFALWSGKTTFYAISDHTEETIIERVVDGDTFKTSDGRTIRLVNINAPEKDSPLSIQSKNRLKEYENKSVELEIVGTDKYDRLLARLYVPDYMNLKLVEEGLVSIFLVQSEERKLFAQAEEQAIRESRGIWKKSASQGCLTISVDKEAEVVSLYNACEGEGKGWYLKDESRKIYKFQEALPPRLDLYSGSGTNNATAHFWNLPSVWNDDRDTAYVFDASHALVAYRKYGYG